MSEGRPEVSPGRPAEGIAVRGVRHRYGDGPDVLHGIDLDIRPGPRLAVVGAAGSGKSTLATLISGMRAPYAGGLTLDGIPTASPVRARPGTAGSYWSPRSTTSSPGRRPTTSGSRAGRRRTSGPQPRSPSHGAVPRPARLGGDRGPDRGRGGDGERPGGRTETARRTAYARLWASWAYGR
ncbi:ATP-binding cassette domain-containing protein [Streptomyces griseofuscus]|uniref:ATP-binding cassette domain-containing protein n=1 Tax=Streptomyces griseofuscus TaxID=146922 RepID=UPI0036FF5557